MIKHGRGRGGKSKAGRVLARVLLGCACLVLGDATVARAEPAATCLSEALVPGMVSERPAKGLSVQVESGYMVPYTQTIPGTDVEFEMVPIPGGTFFLGSPADEPERLEGEGPQVEVSVPPMWVAKYEITWSEYKQYMRLCGIFEKFDDLGIRQLEEEDQVDAITAPSKLYEPGFTFSVGQGPRQPAVSMSQYAAKQYTKWLSLLTRQFYRLPTEAEWEYACRAGTTTAYSFGESAEDLDAHAWHYENADDETHPVGEKKPNAWGLYDMHGNASEWVLDAYEADWYEKLKTNQQTNPGPTTSKTSLCWPKKLFPRVLRGGSWNLDPPDCRSAIRRPSHDDNWRSYDPNAPKSPWWFASDESQDVGFRIVRPLQSPPIEGRGKYWDADVRVIRRVVDRRIDEEGRGERGIVDPGLPEAIEKLNRRDP